MRQSYAHDGNTVIVASHDPLLIKRYAINKGVGMNHRDWQYLKPGLSSRSVRLQIFIGLGLATATALFVLVIVIVWLVYNSRRFIYCI